jgi:hypothetical protein
MAIGSGRVQRVSETSQLATRGRLYLGDVMLGKYFLAGYLARNFTQARLSCFDRHAKVLQQVPYEEWKAIVDAIKVLSKGASAENERLLKLVGDSQKGDKLNIHAQAVKSPIGYYQVALDLTIRNKKSPVRQAGFQLTV